MSFRGSFVESLASNTYLDGPSGGIRFTGNNADDEDYPVVLDCSDDDEESKRNMKLLHEEVNQVESIDQHRSAQFGGINSIVGSLKADLDNPINASYRNRPEMQKKITFGQTFGETVSFDSPGGVDERRQSYLEKSNDGVDVVASEEDLVYIQEVLQSASAELKQKEIIPRLLPQILEMTDMEEINNALNTCTQDIQTQFQEFQRVIDFGAFLLDQVKKARTETEEIKFAVDVKDREIVELQEQQSCILSDWKLEQRQTRELENALQKSQENILKLQDSNNRQRVTIDQMARENERLVENAQKKLTPKNQIITPNAQDHKQSKFKFDFIEEKNQMRQEIEMLEGLLLEKTTELEEAERLNEINCQKIKQTIELNEQLYFDIEDTTLALQEYEQKIQQLESVNKQYADECLRLESLLQSQPNKMIQQMKMAGQLSIDENTSQRTQSVVGLGLTQSQRTFDIHNDYNANDDNISKSSNFQTKRATAVTNKLKPKLNLAIQSTETQLQKLAKEQRLDQSGLHSVKNNQNNTMQNLQLDQTLTSKKTSQRQNFAATPSVMSSYSRIAKGLQIEVEDEKELEHEYVESNRLDQENQHNTVSQQYINEDIVPQQHFQFDVNKVEGTDQKVQFVDNDVRKSQVSEEFHFENQDEIHPDEGADQFPVVEENDLIGLEDQDGQPVENFGQYEYAQRPSYLMNSRISAFSQFEKPQATNPILNESLQVPITQKLKERAGQIKRIIETTDIVENQNMFEDIRKTFASQRQSVILTGNLPNAPEPRQVFVPPKTSRAQASGNKFDFSQKPQTKALESPTGVVNNTYITNHFNNFPTKPTVEELILGPHSLQIRSTQAATAPKKLDLVDLDHYQPSKKLQQNLFGNGPVQNQNIEHIKSGQVTPIRSSFNNTRASYIKLTESMLGAMPVIVEEEEIKHKQACQINDAKNREPTNKQLSIQVESHNENNRLSANSDNYNLLLPSPSESQTTGSIRRRSVAGRKEPEEEFFSMTLVSQIMCHSKKNLLISLQQDSNKLFKECKKNKKPFFEWPTWISAYLETEIKRMKASSLAKAQKIGARKILGK